MQQHRRLPNETRFSQFLSSVSFSPAVAVRPSSQSQASQAAGAGPPQQVAVASVESQKLDTTLTLPAQITPYEAVDVYPKVTGFIETIRVDRGSRVHAGELIIHLSAPELIAQRTQAEASLHSAEAQLAAAQAKLASDHGTYLHLEAAAKTPGVVAGNDLLVAEQTAAADNAQVEAASNNVQAARDSLRSVTQLESYLEIRAPFDGVVTQRNLHPGALVGPASGQAGAQPIVRIESVSRLRVVVPVPEAYVAGVREGQQVTFRVPAYPERTLPRPHRAHLARYQSEHSHDAGRARFSQRRSPDHAGFICKRRVAHSSNLRNSVRARVSGHDRPAANVRDSGSSRKSRMG